MTLRSLDDTFGPVAYRFAQSRASTVASATQRLLVLFNSIEYFVFFPLVVALFFASPHRWRALLLLAASCYFYAAFIPAYLLILVFTIVVDYFAGILIEGAVGARRKVYLAASIVANVGVLAVFKYYAFLDSIIVDLAALAGIVREPTDLGIVLPLGLSFHTFQAMSYTIEVFRGHERAERSFVIYALYVMFFPQLVAGPIERPQNLLHQFRTEQFFDPARATDGLRQILVGAVKKVVVADRLAAIVDRVYESPTDFPGPALAFATVCFALQIYADFSGYSDIAIGSAKILGFNLMTNFDHPYVARSISEFWRRWHISLSTWFKDYLYVPLGGNRKGFVRTQVNLFITFLVSGLWHGASWTFVIWGAINGVYLVAANITRDARERIAVGVGLTRFPRFHAALQVTTTFGLCCLAWVFFRANTFADAVHVVEVLLQPWTWLDRGSIRDALVALDLPGADLRVALIALFGLLMFDAVSERVVKKIPFARRPTWVRWTAYYCALAVVLVWGRFGAQQFIYFQF